VFWVGVDWEVSSRVLLYSVLNGWGGYEADEAIWFLDWGIAAAFFTTYESLKKELPRRSEWLRQNEVGSHLLASGGAECVRTLSPAAILSCIC
jgi:hypothetical protein